MVENFNILSKLAKGKYIKFLASDDKLDKNFIVKSIEPFHKFDNLVLGLNSKECYRWTSK